MVHHHMEITEIEQWQIVSSLVHSSLVVHCGNRLKFLKDSFLSNCRLFSIVGLIMFNHHGDRLSHHSQPRYEINSTTIFPYCKRRKAGRGLGTRLAIDISLRISGSLLLYTHLIGKCKIVLIAAHSWDNIP